MAFSQEFPGAAVAGERAGQAWRLPIGAVSPLWAVFGAAASVGVAFWWMSQWTRAVNFEALGAVKPVAAPEPTAPVAVIAEPAAAVETPAIEAPIAEAVAAPDAAPAAAEPPAPDDLARMVGIGPKLSAALAERGVTRFADIAAWTAGDLAEVDVALSLKGRAVREAWVAQARRLAADA